MVIFWSRSYGYYDLICDNAFLHHIENMLIDHLPYDDSCHLIGIWLMQHLSHTEAIRGRTIGFHICNGGRLPAPGTVDKEFCVNAEQLVELGFVVLRASGDIAHGEHIVIFQLL